jgi:hypothetical protein
MDTLPPHDQNDKQITKKRLSDDPDYNKKRNKAYYERKKAENPNFHNEKRARFLANHPDYEKEQYARDKEKHARRAKEKYARDIAKNPDMHKEIYARKIAENPQYYHERYKKFMEQNPDYRKKKYGITLDQWYMILELQEFKCAVCKGELDIDNGLKTIHTDHNHITGELRGIVHARCNLLVGMIETAKDLQMVLNYIEENGLHDKIIARISNLEEEK